MNLDTDFKDSTLRLIDFVSVSDEDSADSTADSNNPSDSFDPAPFPILVSMTSMSENSMSTPEWLITTE